MATIEKIIWVIMVNDEIRIRKIYYFKKEAIGFISEIRKTDIKGSYRNVNFIVHKAKLIIEI